jgi:hypothetical protein
VSATLSSPPAGRPPPVVRFMLQLPPADACHQLPLPMLAPCGEYMHLWCDYTLCEAVRSGRQACSFKSATFFAKAYVRLLVP